MSEYKASGIMYRYMIPSPHLVRKVRCYYKNWLVGLKFYRKDGSLILEIGDDTTMEMEEISIAEDERIVGIRSLEDKTAPAGHQLFCFLICSFQ